jgi:hypothetical protein
VREELERERVEHGKENCIRYPLLTTAVAIIATATLPGVARVHIYEY